jgi:pimeloyl-[acyl-carrier protein] synthase
MSWLYRVDAALFGAQMGLRLALERLETGITFNPTRPALRVDPHPFYRELRQRDPFHRSRPADGWVLSRYADVLGVLSDKSFSSDERNQRRWGRMMRLRRLAGLSDPYVSGLVTMLRTDAPDHTRVRNLVNKAFTPRAVERMRPRIEAVIEELVAPLEPGRSVDLVSAFAAPLPVVVIAEMLGIPSEDRERFRTWSDDVVRQLGDATLEDARCSDRARAELIEYFGGILEQRRAEPRDDLISALVAAEEDGRRLSRQELFGTLVLLLVAGNETTTKLICNSVLALLAHPEQLALLREEPKRITGAVDELLRFDGPVQLTSRIVTEDRELAGRRLKRGQQIVLLLAAANRDPESFPDPDRLDVTRENVRHLAFGQGVHYCLGAQLAKLETGLALQALLTRFPGLCSGPGRVSWGSNTVLRGPTQLPLTL